MWPFADSGVIDIAGPKVDTVCALDVTRSELTRRV